MSHEIPVERHVLERDLDRALNNEDEFVLHYQSTVDTSGGRMIGAEAIIRWHYPTRGVVIPAAFIPRAEESDLNFGDARRCTHTLDHAQDA